MKVNIVGTQFSKAFAEGIKENSTVIVEHDPTNEFDDKALAVIFNNERLGYVGKNSEVYSIDREEFPKAAYVKDFYRKQEGDKFSKHTEGTLVSCEIFIEHKTDETILSFTENVPIEFNEDKHQYSYKGKVCTGGTSFIKKYLEPFDLDGMAERCSNIWKVDIRSVKEAWKLSQQLAASYGTGIHKALEFEDAFRHHLKADGTRCFTIKHPKINSITQEFFELYDSLGFKGEVIPEVLVSDVENNLCGLIDRLVITSWEDKTCRLQDYKVNHSFTKNGSEKIVNLPKGMKLPNTKLSKLSLQLKYYAALLEKQGWTVEGFDAFVYSDKWEYFSADMLEGFDIMEGTYEENKKNKKKT